MEVMGFRLQKSERQGRYIDSWWGGGREKEERVRDGMGNKSQV
jgi:hypothetical protein